jgi:hypothetical protein
MCQQFCGTSSKEFNRVALHLHLPPLVLVHHGNRAGTKRTMVEEDQAWV